MFFSYNYFAFPLSILSQKAAHRGDIAVWSHLCLLYRSNNISKCHASGREQQRSCCNHSVYKWHSYHRCQWQSGVICFLAFGTLCIYIKLQLLVHDWHPVMTHLSCIKEALIWGGRTETIRLALFYELLYHSVKHKVNLAFYANVSSLYIQWASAVLSPLYTPDPASVSLRKKRNRQTKMDRDATTPHIFSATAEPTIMPHVSRYTAHADITIAPTGHILPRTNELWHRSLLCHPQCPRPYGNMLIRPRKFAFSTCYPVLLLVFISPVKILWKGWRNQISTAIICSYNYWSLFCFVTLQQKRLIGIVCDRLTHSWQL